MRFSAKANIVLFSGLLGGALVAGVGCGIAFAEYLSFDYDGAALEASSERTTESFTFDIEEDDLVQLSVSRIVKLTEDESVEQGSLVIEASYNPNFLKPYFYADDSLCYLDEEGELVLYEDGESRLSGEDFDGGVETERGHSTAHSGYAQAISVKTIRMDYADYVSDFDVFMRNKEIILENLKNRTITSFEDDRDIEIIVHVNPADAGRLDRQSGALRGI